MLPTTAFKTLKIKHFPQTDGQPFTRSLGGVVIPEGITEVTIRARDNVDGWSTATYT